MLQSIWCLMYSLLKILLQWLWCIAEINSSSSVWNSKCTKIMWHLIYHLNDVIRGHLKKTYEFVNLRALMISTSCIIASFNVWGRCFVWNFKGTLWNSTQNILPIHCKMYSLLRSEVQKIWNLQACKHIWNDPWNINVTRNHCYHVKIWWKHV